MATQTRAALDASNALNITGAGKVNKARHATHNNNIGDYIDFLTLRTNTSLSDGANGLVLTSSLLGNYYSYIGSDERTFKLEAIASNTGKLLTIINSSELPSGAECTLQSNTGVNDIQNGADLVTSILFLPGDVKTFYNNGLKWVVI